MAKCLKTNKFDPYHIKLNQKLIEVNFERKLTFSQWALGKINDNEDIFKFCYILISHKIIEYQC